MAVKAPSRHKPEAVIRERARIIGDSGKVYMELAENEPEIVQLIPAKGKYAPKREKGAQKAATGAELYAMGMDPNDPEVQRRIASGQVNYGTPASTITPPATRPQVASSVGVNQPATMTSSNYGAAGTAQYQAAQRVQQAQQADIDASRGINTAAQSQLAASRGVIAASTSSTEAARRALGSQQQYLDTQERLTGEARVAEQGIQSAAANTEDKVAVARAQQERDDTDYAYDVAGVSRPKEVVVASGTNLPTGVRAAFETQEDLRKRNESNAAAMRAFEIEGGRIATARTSAEAQAADIEAENARRVAEAAGLDVDAARLQADVAGLGVRQSQLDMARTTTPPAPGQVYDPDSGTFTTQGDLDMRNAGRSIVEDPLTGQLTTRSDLLSRTDAMGNVRRADGVWVDPRTKNEYVNGVWTSPEGNVRQPDPQTGVETWISPQGLVLRNGKWWNLELGAYLQSDGSFYQPITGQTFYNGEGFLSSGGYANESIRAIDARNNASGAGSYDLSGLFN
jgi:hypothetical protein